MIELSKAYAPAEFEDRWYRFWEEQGYFRADPESAKPKYSIVIPPPNVTGRLHIGHALVNTLQDVLVRWKRMLGYEVLWLPGTDHAGISTQMVVERELAAEGTSRLALGREKFEARVWVWKEQYGGEIVGQLKKLGASCDWSRLRFTLDPELSRAVRKVFVDLYRDGLIYRDRYIVNWCPRCATAISDLEVEYREVNGKLWSIAYPLAGADVAADSEYRLRELVVATTRPETMLGDTAVAVHPADLRYRDLVGQEVILPIAGRRLKIIADDFVDREFGTGVVKITPAHDPNDFAAAKRHDIPAITVIGEDAKMTAAAGEEYAGLDRFAARKKIVAKLEEIGALRATEPHPHAVGHCEKCGTVVEPSLSLQWFVRIAPLAAPALAAVEEGRVRLTPRTWENTYYEWMRNIHDWCISRQLWWGHRIPAWTCTGCGKLTVAETDPPRCPGCGGAVTQVPDVLDTWFSSALWPFSTMGWPAETADLRAFYPTSVLVTGFDIIFFWVARMIMMGLRFTGREPFADVYFNALVRDEHGQKMSKTKGNVIDPLDVIADYGADAVRFTLASLAAPGRDIPLARDRMKGYAAFANKIWNAARFALMNVSATLAEAGDVAAAVAERGAERERWILSRLSRACGSVNDALNEFRFDEAANLIYQFFWREFCDWYLELAKPALSGTAGDAAERELVERVVVHVLDQSLRLLHPFMPFLTEEIWQKLGPAEASIMLAAYPQRCPEAEDAVLEAHYEAMMASGTATRNPKARPSPRDRAEVYFEIEDGSRRDFFARNLAAFETATHSRATLGPPPADAATLKDLLYGVAIALCLPAEAIDVARLRKDLAALEGEIRSVGGKLGNAAFLARAPQDVIDKNRERAAELAARRLKIEETLASAAARSPLSQGGA